MRAKALLVLLGATALGAYYVGRHSSPVNNAAVAAVAQPQPPVAKPVAFAAPISPPLPRPRPKRLYQSGPHHQGPSREATPAMIESYRQR
jgi:hypothetical protein